MSIGRWPGRSFAATTLREQTPLVMALRALGIMVVLVLAGMLVVWGVDLGRRIGGLGSDAGPTARLELTLLESELTKVAMERDQLLAAAQQTETQIRVLQVENRKLRADLTLIGSLVPAQKAGAGLVIRAMQADLAENQLHYILLLAHGPKMARPQFAGQVQLAVTLLKDGKSAVMEFSDEKNAAAAQYGASLPQYQRLDGVLNLPPGVTVTTVQARLIENGKIIALQSIGVKNGDPVLP